LLFRVASYAGRAISTNIGGYQFSRYIAAELGYSPTLTKASASGFGVTADVKASAWELVAIPSYPIGELSLYGKLGFYAAKTEGRSNAGVSADDSNTDLTYGLGAGYRINRNFSVRAEWQRYSKVGGENNGEADVDVLSLGVLYRF
jgi:OOP family OmpA-OmpF porin